MTKLHPLLDRGRQEQARRYERENQWLGLARLILSLMILSTFYFSGLSARLAHLFPGGSIVWSFIIYIISIQTGWTILGLPLHFYSSYIHEHKWNFSNQTIRSWLWDQIKSFFLGLTFLLLISGLLLWLMTVSPQKWWLGAGLAGAMMGVIFAALFPILILPIFNKYLPIQDKELTDTLEKILSREGLRSSGFFKEDSSRQTKKENAFLAGLGKTRRVVLSDNLMENMTIPEIESIIAHEVGHFKHRHIWKDVGISTLERLVVFCLVDLVMKSLFPQFLSSARSNLALLPMFTILMGAISGLVFSPFHNALSRHFENQADRYALERTENKKAFMTALAGLANRNLSNAYPRWLIKLLYYTHPPIGERLSTAENFHPQ